MQAQHRVLRRVKRFADLSTAVGSPRDRGMPSAITLMHQGGDDPARAVRHAAPLGAREPIQVNSSRRCDNGRLISA